MGESEPERLVGVGVAQNFLDVLGIQPKIGRNFVDEECIWDGRRAVLLTHTFWERRYGTDLDIVGHSITLNDQPTTVVGVLPAWFDFASVFSPGSRIDFLIPFPISDETDRQGNTLVIIGRLKPGVTNQNAQAELDLINRQLKEADPARWGSDDLRKITLQANPQDPNMMKNLQLAIDKLNVKKIRGPQGKLMEFFLTGSR